MGQVVRRTLIQMLSFMLIGSVFIGIGGCQEQKKLPAKDGINLTDKGVIMLQIKTSMGDIDVELYEKLAPESVKNFLSYVDSKYYDGTIFHRIIDNFMIQGGGMTPDMQNKPTQAPIKNEAGNGLKNDRGTLAMARTSEIHSATSQFFINVVDNHFLNHTNETPQGFGYCVFGKVTSGMEIVDKMKGVKTTTKGFNQNVPVEPVTIISITRK